MKRKFVLFACISTAFVIGMFAADRYESNTRSGQPRSAQPLASNKKIRELPRLKGAAAEALLNEIAGEFKELETELITQLRSNIPITNKVPAIFLCGFYRMEGTVPDLVNFIKLQVPEPSHFRMPLWRTHPTVEALVKIGKRTTPAMLGLLTTSNDDETRKLAARVISYLEGPEIGKVVLEKAIQKESNAETKKRLQAALAYLEEGTVR